MIKIIKDGQIAFVPLKTTFNGTVLDDVLTNSNGEFKTINVSGRELLSEEHSSTVIDGRDGSYYSGSKLSTRTLIVTASISGKSVTQCHQQFDALMAFLDVAKPVPISFSDDPNYFFYAKFKETGELDILKSEAVITLKFICYDPLKYSNNKSVTGDTVTYNGKRPYRPKVTLLLTGSASVLKLLHVQSGRFVRITGNYVSGQKIVFDLASGSITQNGADIVSQFDMLGSRRFALVPGKNQLTSSIPATMTIDYREVFR